MLNKIKNYCIVSYCNLYMCPYVREYIELISNNSSRFDLVYWDRDAKQGETDDNFGPLSSKKVFNYFLTNTSNKVRKVKGYFAATKFFRRILKNNNYDGVFFLQSHGAVLCSRILRKKYQNRFIIDVRDFTLEDHGFYKKAEKKLFKKAYKVVISSPAYSSFLPSGIDYIVAHNYVPMQISRETLTANNQKNHLPIRISFVGTVRFLDMDKKILNLFKNDDRFVVCYYGAGSEILKDYCGKNQINNVDFSGRFPNSETKGFYLKTDIINNLYGNNSPFLDYALSNKLYHSAQLLIPILVCPNTYMETITKQYSLGFVFDVNDSSAPDRLFNEYIGFDFRKMKKGADEFLNSVFKDNRRWKECIMLFCENKDI